VKPATVDRETARKPSASAGDGATRANLVPAKLIMQAVRAGEARLNAAGALVARTGIFTGRSPRDKFVVARPDLAETIDWGDNNQPLEPERFARLLARARAYARNRPLYRQDLHAGADPRHRLRVRVWTEQAWHALFARNMFIRPTRPELAGYRPDWEVLHLPGFRAEPTEDGTRSETVVAIDFATRIVLIANTLYAGEIKKSIFTVLNHLLPERGVLPMHCSANASPSGKVALFFGLSGTGKTTLSADADRILIGDDEHGWSDRGVFNFEGGCYAKVIRLRREAEPEIWDASNRFGAILENVVLDPDTLEPDFDDPGLTENTRSSYPLDFIPNASRDGLGGHPTDIVMLACDAFGVLPPISRLTPEQAMYHFLSGYTARVAGTERGVTAPKATFSACFGAPFMPRHPSVYARLLGEFMHRHRVRCWLLNTGWSGGGYSVGERMPLELTRALLHAALAGELDGVPSRIHPAFGLAMPAACPGIDAELLDPRASWTDKRAYDEAAAIVAKLFAENFEKFRPYVGAEIARAGLVPG